MDVYDLSSQEEFSPLKPLAKRARVKFDVKEGSLEQKQLSMEQRLKKGSSKLNCVGSGNQGEGTVTGTTMGDNAEPSAGGDRDERTVECVSTGDDIELSAGGDKGERTVKCVATGDDTEPSAGGDLVGPPVYICSEELIALCDQMPKIANRASMVHSLIQAYGLLKYMQIVIPRRATEEELLGFHARDYIEFLHKLSLHDDEEKFEEEAAQYGLSYDCPVNQHVYEYGCLTGGASVRAAECLVEGKSRIAINWCGGWHHAKRDTASGFCYVNDIVLAIHKLREKFNLVLYVDLDVHHGDGVEDAFCASTKVMTLSVHKHASGFFPGTGSLKDVGLGKGKGYTINIPLNDGLTDEQFVTIMYRCLMKVREVFNPQAVVCQCGVDGLAGDPMDSFNLTHSSYGKILFYLLEWNLPTLMLGGGGYNHVNTARCWTYLTSIVTRRQLPPDIPDHKYFTDYGPDYDLAISHGNRKNLNTPKYLKSLCQSLHENLSKMSSKFNKTSI